MRRWGVSLNIVCRRYCKRGPIVLVVTGAEALYADMGHFGIGPIRIGWYLLVALLTEVSKNRFGFTKQNPWLDKILGVVFIALAIKVVLSL